MEIGEFRELLVLIRKLKNIVDITVLLNLIETHVESTERYIDLLESDLAETREAFADLDKKHTEMAAELMAVKLKLSTLENQEVS